ncbi:type I-E CRISPR-associated protein Cas5/CasD [Streptosporangium sp. NPDC002607]
MSTATLLLGLDAPLQSWGVQSRFERRDTGTEPSKSGIVGLLAAALGVPRDGDIRHLAAFGMAVRCDREGQVERDYHTTQNVPTTDGKSSRTIVSERHYLADACFLVALEGSAEHIEQAAEGLAKPVFPLFLGRKAFAAPPDLFLGLTDLPATEAIRKHPWLERRAQAVRKARHDAESGKPQMLRISCDSEPSPSAHLRHDHPVSFAWGNRQFAPRYVRTDFVPLTLDLLPSLKEQACT